MKRVEKFRLITRVAFSHLSAAECFSRENDIPIPASRCYLVVLCLHDMELRLLVETRRSFGEGDLFAREFAEFVAAQKTRLT